LKEIIFIERDIESAKIDLALKSDFNLVDAFRLFDMRGFGAITSQDLVDGLRLNLDFGEFCPDDIYMFFKRIDRTSRGRITFNEFGEAMLPFS
jgi:Ca2+-binding EF-hand superfamily protein